MSTQHKLVTRDRGTFVVSLDFELAWGTRGRPSADKVGRYLEGTRPAIDRMLQLFQQYEVSATWVMVGGLLLGGSSRHPLLGDSPKHYMHHFDLISQHGFKCYRGPETGWFERLPTAPVRGAMRLLNSRLRRAPMVGLPTTSPEGLVEIPSSHFYAPFQSVGKYVSLNDRIAQAIAGLNAAAKQKRIYHLWTHPFNMGADTESLMDGLKSILQHFQTLRDSGQLECRSMGALVATE